MKKYLIMICMFLTTQTFCQSEFKISVDNFRWENPSLNRVILTIFLTIRNVGNEKGWCEDLKGLYLDCPDSYYFLDIKVKDYSNNLTNYIRPGDFVEAFISFDVSREADNLSLRFSEFYGGANKFITESYNKYLSSENNKKFESYLSEGNLRMSQNNPEDAVTQYKFAMDLNVDKQMINEAKLKLAEAYESIGDKNTSRKIWNFAIDEYRNALSANSTVRVREKIAFVYRSIGDQKYGSGLLKEALDNYELSLMYKEDSQVRLRKNQLIDQIYKKENRERKQRKARLDYQSLLSPNVGFKLGGGLSFQSNANTGGTGTFWTANINVVPKLYVGKSTALTAALNFDLSASGMISSSSGNKEFKEFFGVKDSLIEGTSASAFVYSLNFGTGFGYLNQTVTPILFVNYGVYLLATDFSLYQDVYNTSVSSPSTFWGHGFKLEINLVFNRKFYFGYSFKSYTISDTDYRIFDSRFTGHSVVAGLMFF